MQLVLLPVIEHLSSLLFVLLRILELVVELHQVVQHTLGLLVSLLNLPEQGRTDLRPSKVGINPLNVVHLVILLLLLQFFVVSVLVVEVKLPHFDDTLIFKVSYLLHLLLTIDLASSQAEHPSKVLNCARLQPPILDLFMEHFVDQIHLCL